MENLTTYNSIRQVALLELLSSNRNPSAWLTGDVLQQRNTKKLYLVTKVIDKWAEDKTLCIVQEIDNHGIIDINAYEVDVPQELFDYDLIGHISHSKYENLMCLLKGHLKEVEK